jgi:hypothetical protein
MVKVTVERDLKNSNYSSSLLISASEVWGHRVDGQRDLIDGFLAPS